VLHADRPRAKAEQTATSQTYFEPRICLRMVWSVMRCDGFHSVLHGCQWVTGWSFGSFPSLCLEPGPALLSRTIIPTWVAGNWPGGGCGGSGGSATCVRRSGAVAAPLTITTCLARTYKRLGRGSSDLRWGHCRQSP
jgi:hypothetical protein